MFFKKRAIFEDEYGRNMQKLAKSTAETYASNEGKAGYGHHTPLTNQPSDLSIDPL